MMTQMNDQEFEQYLQQQMQQSDYIEDDGFTAALMAQLPAKPRRSSAVKAKLGVVLMAILSCVIVWNVLPVQIPVGDIMQVLSQPLVNIWIYAGMAASLMAGSVLILWNDRSRFFEL